MFNVGKSEYYGDDKDDEEIKQVLGEEEMKREDSLIH